MKKIKVGAKIKVRLISWSKPRVLHVLQILDGAYENKPYVFYKVWYQQKKYWVCDVIRFDELEWNIKRFKDEIQD